jgi:Tfp pilus assembly protein FimT
MTSKNSKTRCPAVRRSCRDTFATGFTLIELLVIVTLMMIVVGLSLPKFTRMLADANVGSAARRFAGQVLYLRSLAAKQGKTFYVELDFENGSYRVVTRKPLTEIELPDDYDYSGDYEEYQRAVEDAAYQEFSDDLIEKSDLRRRVEFMDVILADGIAITATGQELVRLAFYPDGSADRAAVHFTNEKEDVYTVEIRPLTARALVFDYYTEPAKELVLEYEDDEDDEPEDE